MTDISIYINNLSKFSFNLSDYKVIDIGLCISKSSISGELQCCGTPNTDGKHDILDKFEIRSGDTLSIISDVCNTEAEFFSSQIINQYKEMYNETNMGNPCKNQLHLIVGQKDRYVTFGDDNVEIFFSYHWIKNKEKVECSIGTMVESGGEQWMKTFCSLEQNVELLFLTNN
jgi:hypothetical protein